MESIITTKKTSEVYCRFDIEGTHSWPQCPHEDVAYLRVDHRHLFKFIVRVSVDHSDRDIEFIRLGHELKRYVVSQYWNEDLHLCLFGHRSCEMLANEVIDCIVTKYGSNKMITVDVSEDGENGAIVVNTPI